MTRKISILIVILTFSGLFINPICPPPVKDVESAPPSDQVNSFRSMIGSERRLLWAAPTGAFSGDFAGYESRGLAYLKGEILKNSHVSFLSLNSLKPELGKQLSGTGQAKLLLGDPTAFAKSISLDRILKETGAGGAVFVLFPEDPSTACAKSQSLTPRYDRTTKIVITLLVFKSEAQSFQIKYDRSGVLPGSSSACVPPAEGIEKAAVKMTQFVSAFFP